MCFFLTPKYCYDLQWGLVKSEYNGPIETGVLHNTGDAFQRDNRLTWTPQETLLEESRAKGSPFRSMK